MLLKINKILKLSNKKLAKLITFKIQNILI